MSDDLASHDDAPDDDEDDALGPQDIGPTPVHGDPPKPAIDIVTALQLAGRNVQLTLSPLQESARLGAGAEPEVDLTLEGDGISRVHALLIRKGPKLRVIDQRSTNGTYFHDQQDPDFEVAPGDVFHLTQRHKVLVLGEHLRVLRTRLRWYLGLHAHGRVDDALEKIAAGGPILLLGARHCDQDILARNIHRCSVYRGGAFVPFAASGPDEEHTAKLAHAAGGTAFLDLVGHEGTIPASRLDPLFAGNSRPIIAASGEDHAWDLLSVHAKACATVVLPPLSARSEDIPRLLAALISKLATKLGTRPSLPIAALGESNIAGLRRYPWSKNFKDLRRAVPRLHALLTNDLKLRASARALGVSPPALAEALKTINVEIKREADEIDEEAIDLTQLASVSMGALDDDDDALPEPPPETPEA